MCFFVEEVAPASDGLSQCNGRSHQVCSAEKVNFFPAAEEIRYGETGNQTAVDGKAALTGIENFRPVAGILFPAENNIIGTCADDGCRHHEDHQIQNKIRVNSVARCTEVTDDGCNQKTASDEEAIPHDIQAEDGECYPVGCNHILYLLLFSKSFPSVLWQVC